MPKISECLVVRNEEDIVRGCLESIKDVVDEIIVVDGYSGDRTVNICREYTDKIYYRKPKGFVEPDRLFALSKATGDWILVIDADERLSEALHDNLRKLAVRSKYTAYAFPRRNYYDADGKNWTKHVFYPDHQIRLFKKNKAIYYGRIHEIPRIIGRIKYMSEPYYIKHLVPNHYSLKKFKTHWIRFAKIHARQTGRSKTRPYYTLKAATIFLTVLGREFLSRKGFLDGTTGFKASFMVATYHLIVNLCISVL